MSAKFPRGGGEQDLFLARSLVNLMAHTILALIIGAMRLDYYAQRRFNRLWANGCRTERGV